MSIAPSPDSELIEPAVPIPFQRRRRSLLAPPTQLTPLFGRDAEVVAISALLAKGDVRLITLVGPGGIGKTRLALGIAAEAARAFDDLVAWADVTTATTPEAVAATLAQSVGVVDTGSAPTIQSLKVALRDDRMLLVVDNFEQALDAAPLLSDLLMACPGVSILITSRALLRIAGEYPIDVPPLAIVQDPVQAMTSPEPAPAVHLFAQRAASVSPSFALTPDNTPIVAEICRRLDGLPLAIELAAARVNHLPLPDLRDRLDHSLAILTVAARGAPDRHRTMRDAIAWSYDLLAADQQLLFRNLAVFADGFTLEAAEAVAGTCSNVLANLGVLVDNSLIRLEPPLQSGARYSMLQTVFEFAIEQLDVGDDPSVWRRHAEYFAELAANAEPNYFGDRPGYERTGIEREVANLRAARAWAVEHGEADMALRLTAALLDPHHITGDSAREQWEWTQRAIALPGGSPQAKAAALSVAVWATQIRSDEFDVRSFGEAALDLARSVGDELGIANAASALGTVKLHAGDVEGARQLLTEALDGFRQVGASGRSAWTLCHLAFLDTHDAIDEGGEVEKLEGALARYEEALAIFRDLAHIRGVVRALHGIAYVTFKKRDLPEALVKTQEVLAMEWEQRWPVIFSYQEDIADIAGRTGQPATAARLYGAADAQRAKLGLPIDPPFRAEYERDVAVARQALDETAFAAHWAAGQSLTEEQAVAEALSVTIPDELDIGGASVATPVSLSPRELEVLRLLASGLSDRAIADALFIGQRTVNTHVGHVLAKLGVRKRAAAVAAAVAAGMLDPDSVGKNASEAE